MFRKLLRAFTVALFIAALVPLTVFAHRHPEVGDYELVIGVTCDFPSTMLHETTVTDEVASISELSSVDVPAGGTVEFKPGGLHSMFMNPAKDLKVVAQVDLTLEFEKAGKATVAATVTEP